MADNTEDCQCENCKDNKSSEHWLQTFWRPMMAVQYFVVCLFDFMLAPILLAIYFDVRHMQYMPWVPLTLQGGGLYHLAVGAILGVSAWTRGQEKITSLQTNAPALPSTPVQNQAISMPVSQIVPVTPTQNNTVQPVVDNACTITNITNVTPDNTRKKLTPIKQSPIMD